MSKGAKVFTVIASILAALLILGGLIQRFSVQTETETAESGTGQQQVVEFVEIPEDAAATTPAEDEIIEEDTTATEEVAEETTEYDAAETEVETEVEAETEQAVIFNDAASAGEDDEFEELEGSVNEIVGTDDEGKRITRAQVVEFEEIMSSYSVSDGIIEDVFWILGIDEKYPIGADNGSIFSGQYLFPMSEEWTLRCDDDRSHSAIKMGLNKAGETIDDASGFAFRTLTPDDVKRIVAAKQYALIKIDDPDAVELEYFEYVLGYPAQLKADWELTRDYQYGDSRPVKELAIDMENFYQNKLLVASGEVYTEVTLADGRRAKRYYNPDDMDGELLTAPVGMDYFTRKLRVNGETRHYVTPEYLEYACLWLNMLYDCDPAFESVPTTRRYHLVSNSVANDQRWMTEANYQESLASMVWPTRLKDGQIAMKFMVNLRTKDPAVGKAITPGKTPPPANNNSSKKTNTNTQPQNTTSNTPSSSTPNTPPSTSDTPGTTPGGTPPGDTPPGKDTPTQPQDGEGVKVAAEGDKGPVNSGKGDNPGPGVDHGNQDDSKSDKVQESQGSEPNKNANDTSNDTPGATQALEDANKQAAETGGKNVDDQNPNSTPEDQGTTNVSDKVTIPVQQDTNGYAGNESQNDDGWDM